MKKIKNRATATYHGVKEFQNSLNIIIDNWKTKSGALISLSRITKICLFVFVKKKKKTLWQVIVLALWENTMSADICHRNIIHKTGQYYKVNIVLFVHLVQLYIRRSINFKKNPKLADMADKLATYFSTKIWQNYCFMHVIHNIEQYDKTLYLFDINKLTHKRNV